METDRKICIRNARVFDPSQDWKGEYRDIYMTEGVISLPFNDPDTVIEAGGRTTLAGGIDPNCYLALPGQAFARMIGPPFFSPEEIGRTYAGMGYVHVHQPFTTLLMAHDVQRSLNRIPFIDKSFRVCLDYRDVGKYIKAGKYADFCSEARAMIHLTGAIGLFLAFPFLKHKQTYYIQKNVSSKKTFEFFAGIEEPDIFPISIWGLSGVFENEIPLAERLIISGLSEALESDNSLLNASRFLEAGGGADLGLNHGGKYLAVDCSDRFLPGTLSIDAGIHNSYPLQYEIRESGLGTNPSRYGWMIANQPGDSVRISLSSISPPLGDICRIPWVITWMIDREQRPESIDRALDGRVFDLSEIARLTRLEPARQLGFNELGHLKTGAAANVAIYDLEPGKTSRQMVEALSNCWCLIKEGVVVREKGSFINAAPPSKIRYRKMDSDLAILKQTALLQNPTLRLENLSITKKLICNG